MSNKIANISKIIAALSVGVAGLAMQPAAHAQVATSLNCTGCVNSTQILDGSVTGADIKDGTITYSDVKDYPGTGGNVFIGNALYTGTLSLCPTMTNMSSRAITAPAAGYLDASVTGQVTFSSNNSGVRVALSPYSATSSAAGSYHYYRPVTNGISEVALSAHLSVNAGTTTFYVMGCRETNLTNPVISVDRININFFSRGY